MKEPTNYELSLFLEIDEKIIDDVLILKNNVKSLDAAINDDGKTLTLLDSLAIESPSDNTNNIFVQELLENLTKEELELINLRYFKDKTQSETAKYFHTNQVQISRNETKILKKLKKSLCESP